MKTIETKNLSFYYGSNGKRVLSDIDFSCEKGTVNVLLGLNGSGKTTLIKLLAGLLNNYQGVILLNGYDFKTFSVKDRSKVISYVAQRSSAADDFSVQEYLLFGNVNKMRFYESPTREDIQRVVDIAKRFEIDYLLERKLGEISGGERQIVSICGAVIQDTDVIILDEPTSALDIKNQNKILSFIKEIAKRENKTFIISSHNPNHALYLNANVFLLQNGNIVEYGKAGSIVSVDKLKKIYGEEIVYSKDLSYNEISFRSINGGK